MAILIKLNASLRRFVSEYNINAGLKLPYYNGVTVAALLEQLEIVPAEVKIIMVNAVAANLEYVLKDGDRIGLFPTIGGG